MLFHKRLNDLIEDGNITKKELARLIGVNPKQIARWAAGEAEPGIYKVIGICKIYNVSADYLLGLPEDMPYPKN